MNELQQRTEAMERQWQMRIERLDYQAQLAQRRYEEVDPSHRLVAATLEQRWNQALEEAQRLKADYQKYRQQQGLELPASSKPSYWPWPKICHDCGKLRRPRPKTASECCAC
jgi:hypothetical protein